MHDIEPYYNWRELYIASEDRLSPFYRRTYSEFEFTHRIYNYVIHPQWDFFGSSTLYCKILFVDYEMQYAVIEFIGEWNDTLHNDIMELKRGLIDLLIAQGINKYILIGENILNFHASDELYYEEWHDDIKDEGGWIVALNFREHVLHEMQQTGIHHYLNLGFPFNDILWRKFKPTQLVDLIEQLMVRQLH